MTGTPLMLGPCGMVTAIGLDALASCAAMRAALDNFQDTRFIDEGGEWIVGSEVQLAKPWRGLTKLAKMAAASIIECLKQVPDLDPNELPLFLCVAEPDRAGRLAALNDRLFEEIERETGYKFAESSALIARGRVGAAVALHMARQRIADKAASAVLIVGVDSLLSAATLSDFQEHGQLLTSENSNGFIPGEAAAAILVRPLRKSESPQLVCVGLGFAVEEATVRAELPLRADGLAAAIKKSVADAGITMGALDFRITDLSGEQYYFKEASLALSRTLRELKEEFDIWHPADTIGEVGAAIGPIVLAVSLIANRKQYSPGQNLLCHFGDTNGTRAALVLTYRPIGGR